MKQPGLMMAYSPLLLHGDQGWSQVLWAGLVTLGVIVNIALLTERFFFSGLSVGMLWWPALCVALLLVPEWQVRLVGLVLTLGLLGVNYRGAQRGNPPSVHNT
ncbi:MAG: hypothetical protein AAF529_22175 [Pseudomonadota bacterium]